MDRSRNLWLATAALVLLGIIFRSVLYQYILLPIAILFWTVWRFVLSVHQSTYWLFLIILCSLLMLRYIRLPRKPAPRLAYGYKLDPVNRVDRWRAMIEMPSRNGGDDPKLRESLRELVICSLAATHQSDLSSVEAGIGTEQIYLPPAIRHYLFPVLEGQGPLAADKPLRPLRIPGFWKQRHKLDQADEAPIEEVIEWVEKFLEVNHDESIGYRSVN